MSSLLQQQARAMASDAMRIAIMFEEGYTDREIKHHFDLDTAHWIVYKTMIANALELR